jgi:TadE-like protein
MAVTPVTKRRPNQWSWGCGSTTVPPHYTGDQRPQGDGAPFLPDVPIPGWMPTMPDHTDTSSPTSEPRGQTLVEFALVLPMLIVLLLGIADFGRVFAAGITVEAMARNAAEAAAQEYLQLRRQTTPLTAPDFDRIHEVALDTVCEEAEPLPNRVAGGGSCSMPIAAVCIHDSAAELAAYAGCGREAAAAPGDCSEQHATWPPTAPSTADLAWVEVRVCYQFTTLLALENLRLPLGWSLSLGDVWLERTRSFTVADY